MSIELAFRIFDTRLRSRYLTTRVDNRGGRAQRTGLVRSRPHHIDAKFGRRVGTPGRQHSLH